LSSRLHIALLDYRDITHPEAGGAERYLDEIFQRVAARGHRVTLLCGAYAGAPREERIGDIRVLRSGSKVTANFAAARAAFRLARRERVDLFVESLCKLPYLLPRFTAIPVLPVVLHLFGRSAFAEANAAIAAYVWLYERLIPRVYRGLRFVALSESTASDLVRRGVKASRMDVVSPGIDSRLLARADLPRSEHPLFAYVGRLKRYKGIDVVIEALALVRHAVPDARLVVVGKGTDRPRLESIAKRLGLAAAVSFTGYVSEEAKAGWLRSAHAVVYPSAREGWGMAAIEAAACGTPVLASAADGLRDAVQDGRTGFLVPHRDPSAWAARMTQIVTDGPLRAKMGAAALEWARRFDWDVQADKMLRVVEEVSAARASGESPR
jgi:glycosyltransferase involved in cell wall biosynthesis